MEFNIKTIKIYIYIYISNCWQWLGNGWGVSNLCAPSRSIPGRFFLCPFTCPFCKKAFWVICFDNNCPFGFFFIGIVVVRRFSICFFVVVRGCPFLSVVVLVIDDGLTP